MRISRQSAIGVAALSAVVTIAALARPASAPKPAGPQEQEILDQLKQEHGFVPKALQVMTGRSKTLPRFMAYGKGIFEGGPLGEKERYLVALAAAVALKSPDCISAHSKRARRYGATEDEVTQTALIAGLIANTSALHAACDCLKPTD
jgi:AhpD family alkylhydroperoxidase